MRAKIISSITVILLYGTLFLGSAALLPLLPGGGISPLEYIAIVIILMLASLGVIQGTYHTLIWLWK